MDRCKEVLAGYSLQDLPNLSGRRFPPGVVHTAVAALPLPFSQNTGYGLYHILSQAAVSAAISRVIGAYSDSTDVLLCISSGHDSSLKPVRVSWDEHRTWQDVVFNTARIFGDPAWPSVPRYTLHTLLGVSERDAILPLAVVHFGNPSEGRSTGGFALTLSINPSNSSISLTVSDRVMHEMSADLFLSQVIAVCNTALDDSFSPVSTLRGLPDLLNSTFEKCTPGEREHLSPIPYVRFATDYLSLCAISVPDRTAARWYPHLSLDLSPSELYFDSITYGDWDRRANQAARWLLSLGLQREDRVAVCMERNISFHIAFVAILRAGGCYVPIDPELPEERQLYIARDSNARFVVVRRHTPPFALFGRKSLDIDDPSENRAIAEKSDSELNLAEPDNVSYLLYTSGTTGNPKGCLLTHRGLAEAAWALSDMITKADIRDPSQGNYLSVASIAFDVHLAEILVPIANRLPILAAPRSELFEDLPYYVKELKITHLGIVPSLIEATLGAVEDRAPSGQASSLRYIASGGEKMSDAILDKWANHPTVRLANYYGPSEVTIGCACRFMDRVTPRANIGRPFPNVSAYVVDGNLSIVLRGAPGELVVEGPLVGRGYLNRPDLTEKVFLEFPEKGNGRWAYRTGDLVRMMPDSTLEILGRIDHQIKLRGVRIESEGISSIIRRAAQPEANLEVVTILAKHPAIASDQLVSFFSWDTSIPISRRKTGQPSLADPPPGLIDKIRIACDKELATYMRPSHILPLSWIPLNANGKTDSKALGQWFTKLSVDQLTSSISGKGPSNRTDSARSGIEIEVMNAIQKSLNIPGSMVSANTSLFLFGLDSMGAIQLSSDLKKVFPQAISPADILARPTGGDIARLLELPHVRGKSIPIHPSFVEWFSSEWLDVIRNSLPHVQVVRVLPPFPLQEGVLFRSVGSNTMYVQHVLTRCNDETSITKLRDAWKAVMKRHDILRTIFHFGRDLVQVVLHPDDVTLPWLEKRADSNEQSFKDAFDHEDASSIASDINASLSTTPGFRLTIYTSTPNTHFFVLSIHHALFDGVSLPVLLKDVEREYLQERLIPFPYSAAVLDQLYRIDLRRAQHFWTQYFSDFNWQDNVIRSPSTNVPSVASVTFTSPLSSIRAKASACGVTLQTVLTCAYGYLLATSLYGRDDVTFGVIRNGRLLQIEGIDVAMCPMITVLPCRLNFQNLGGILTRAQEDTSHTVEHEHVALSKINRWVHPDQGLFETLFSVSFQDNSRSSLWDVIGSENPKPEYILALEVVLDIEKDTLLVQAAYTAEDIPSDMVESLVKDFEQISLDLCDGNLQKTQHTVSQPLPPMITSIPPEANSVSSLSTPSEETLTTIRAIVSEFLRIDPSLLSDTISLFSIGLDSIRSVGLSRALQAQGMHIPSLSIMNHPTIIDIASRLSQNLPEVRHKDQRLTSFKESCQRIRDAVGPLHLPLSAEDNVEIFPTTTLQAGMLSQTLNSRGNRYLHLFPLRLRKRVDSQRLHMAWETVVQSSSILRTSFHYLVNLGSWAQATHSAADLKWSEEEVSSIAGVASQWYKGLVSSFNWDDDAKCIHRPPLYLHLVKGPDISLVLVAIHHALYDGVSITRLFETVQDVYDGREVDTTPSFKDLLPHILWQERHGTEYFLQLLEGTERKPIPRTGSSSDLTFLDTHEIIIEDELLEQTRVRAGVTLQCLGQTAFAQLLSILTKSNDIVFGHVVSGRSLPGAEDVLGPVLSTIPFRFKLDAAQSNLNALQSVHQSNIRALPWQHASLRVIQRAKGVESLWDSLFVFQPEQNDSSLTDEPLWTFEPVDEIIEGSAHYALNLELHKTSHGFRIHAACRADAMSAEDLKNTLLKFEQLFRNIVIHPENSCCEDIPSSTHPDVEKRSPVPTIPNGVHRPEFEALNQLLASISGLAIEHLHPDTNLIALGIDSINAIQLASKARHLGFSLRAQDVVQSRTVEDLYNKCGSNQNPEIVKTDHAEVFITGEEAANVTSLIKAVNADSESLVESITFASPGMKWLAGAWQKSRGSRFQHAFAYRLQTTIKAEDVHRAWRQLLDRHAILRSTIVSVPGSGQPRIVTFKSHPIDTDLTWSEVSLSETGSPQKIVLQDMKELISNPPSLRQPPTRAKFFNSREGNFLVLYMNHFQYDAWSLQLLVDDLARLISGHDVASTNDLLGWLQATVPATDSLAEQEQYWRTIFPSPPKRSYLLVSSSIPSTDKQQSTERIVSTKLDALPLASSLQVRARQLNVSLQAVLLAAWTKVQARYTKSDAITFGLWHAGRSGSMIDGGLERLAVPCMNVLPFHVSEITEESMLQVALRIQDDLRRRSPVIEQTDLEKVDEWVGGGGKPLCNVYINVIKVAPEVGGEHSGLLSSVEAPYVIPKIEDLQSEVMGRLKITDLIQDDIMVDIIVSPEHAVGMSIEAASNILDGKAAEEIIHAWSQLVEETLQV